jgi:ribonuclease HII
VPDFELEEKYSVPVAGLDEAGRGPLAGPVVASAVILDPRKLDQLEGLDDSKKMSEKKRDKLAVIIKGTAVAWQVAEISPAEIDQINILQASLKAMRHACNALDPQPGAALVDGNQDPKLPIQTQCVIKGDSKSLSIAAASVLAKTHRDAIMKELDKKYPVYGFAGHKGYPSKKHREAIREHGPCPVHRMSFTLLPK